MAANLVEPRPASTSQQHAPACSPSITHSSSRNVAARGTRRQRPKALWVMLGVYMVIHTMQIMQQSQLWLGHLRAGHALSRTARGHLLLTAFELFTVSSSAYLLHGMVKGVDDGEFADRGFIVNGICQPLFQNIKAAVCPDFLAVERTWWALEVAMMLIGVLCGSTPVYSALQLSVTTPLMTRMRCYSSCYIRPSCNLTLWDLGFCFITHGCTITMAGLVSWAATYTVMRSRARRQRTVCEQAAAAPAQNAGVAVQDGPSSALNLLTEHGAASPRLAASSRAPTTATAATPSRRSLGQDSTPAVIKGGVSTPRKQAMERTPSLRVVHKEAVAPAPTTPARAARAAHTSSQTGTGSRTTTTQSSCMPLPSPIPFETFGVYLFRRLGMVPAMWWFEEYVNRIMDRIDDGMVVRLVCIPIVVYSLVFALLIRMRIFGFSFSDMSTDMFVVFMVSGFMLGRDSCTFDMLAAMQQVQEQLAASFASLARPQTVTELVDSVRQQISGQHGSVTEARSDGDEVQMLELLGEGTFGKVHKGMWRGTVVAIKSMVLPSNAGLRRERMAIMEAAISTALSHPNVLQTYTYMLQQMQRQAVPGDSHTSSSGAEQPATEANGFEVRLILEYMDKGTLRDALDTGFLIAPSGDEVHYDLVLDTAADVAKGMLHLHSLNIIHGDLKARNVLLKSSALESRGVIAKIADFGLSHRMEEMETHISSMFQGTPSHMAPEVLLEGTQSKAADVYSFGITLWEIYTSRRPFSDVAKALLPHYVAEKGERPHFPRGTPVGYVNLTQRCWAADASARPSFREIVACLAQLRKDLDEGYVDEEVDTPATSRAMRLKSMTASSYAEHALQQGAQQEQEEEEDPFVRWREVDDWQLRPSKQLPSVPPVTASPRKAQAISSVPLAAGAKMAHSGSALAAATERLSPSIIPFAGGSQPLVMTAPASATIGKVGASASHAPAPGMGITSPPVTSTGVAPGAQAAAASSKLEKGQELRQTPQPDWASTDMQELPSGIFLGGVGADATESIYC